MCVDNKFYKILNSLEYLKIKGILYDLDINDWHDNRHKHIKKCSQFVMINIETQK